MSHEIGIHDRVLSVKGTEWHGLAHHVENIGDEEMAYLCFPIVTGTPSIHIEDPENPENSSVIHLDTYQTVLADIRQRGGEEKFIPLHVPKRSYRPISNAEVYECIKEAIKDVPDVKITTAGTLHDLRKFFISLDTGGAELIGPRGDKFSAYLNAQTAHDGTMTLEFKDSWVRIVCMNTFRASSMYDAGALHVSIPHTKNAKLQMSSFASYLNAILIGRERVLNAMSFLDDIGCNADHINGFLSGYFTHEDAKELSTQAFNRIEEIRNLFKNGKGNNGKTRYDLFNGITEFFTSGDGAGGKKASKVERMTAAQFGKAADHKEQLLSLLTDEDKFQEMLARGLPLYSDKAVAMSK